MTTQRALAALVVIVGVVAIGAAAAGVDQTDQQSGVSDNLGQGEGDGPGRSGSGDDRGAASTGFVGFPAWVVEWYLFITLGVFSLIGLAGAAYYVWKERLDALTELIETSLATIAGVLLLFAFVGVLLWFGLDWSTFEAGFDGEMPEPGGGAQQNEQTETTTGIPPVLIVGVVLVLVVLAGILLRRLGSDEDDEPADVYEEIDLDEHVDEDTGGTTAPVELVDENPDNPVYRAWRDLASRAGLAHERNRTAGEVAQTAIEQGLPQDAVVTLTTVFSEVRYGHRPVTDERERRARSALESIEGTGGGQ